MWRLAPPSSGRARGQDLFSSPEQKVHDCVTTDARTPPFSKTVAFLGWCALFKQVLEQGGSPAVPL